MEMYPGISKMFKSGTGFDPDDSLVIFKFLNIDGPHYKYYHDNFFPKCLYDEFILIHTVIRLQNNISFHQLKKY